MKQNKFKIITPSFNNEMWVEYNLASILNQTYQNFEVLYINDASTDNTLDKVKAITEHDPRFTIINNEVNRGATYNYFEHLAFVNDDDVVIHLDGDDWLIDETVLDKLNSLYNEADCWMTYGGFVVWDGENITQPYPQNTEYPDFVHEYKLYRRDLWRASHLRTYRGFILKAVDLTDLKSLETNEYYWHASDLAFQYPCMEMCGADKISVVDFNTCVYNQHTSIVNRTRARESVDNSKYEIEIRNRKIYKQGIGNGKLPLVRSFGDYRERNDIPKKFSYAYNVNHNEYDITLLQDPGILDYLSGKIPNPNGSKIVAEIAEPPHIMHGGQETVYEAVKSNYDKFDRIITWHEELLSLPNAVFMNLGGQIVLNKKIGSLEYPTLQDNSLIQLYLDKPKHVSVISSNKTMCEGHLVRLRFVEALASKKIQGVDFYGENKHSSILHGLLKDITGKIEALRDYKFSVAIENGIYRNFFTEKILDCFLTGTIPIYYGCPNIGDFFDTRGFFVVSNQEELLNVVSNITTQDYIDRQQYVEYNFKKAHDYIINNDIYFEKYLKDLI
jgi:glycosyltransferase involved in cell wall biosynthesis